MVTAANGEVQTSEEAQVFVHDLDLFVTVQLLEDTRAVLSSGKLCDEHGYTYEWASGQRPHPTTKGKRFCARQKLSFPLLSQDCQQVPQARAQVRPLHRHRRTRQMLSLQVQQHNEVTILTLKHREIVAILPKPKTQMQRRATIKHRVIECEISLSGQRSSQKISKIQKCQDERIHQQHISRFRFRTSCLGGIKEAPEMSKRTKITRVPCRRRTGDAVPRAEKFGAFVTADHKVLDEGGDSRNNQTYAVVVQGLATQWIHSYPCKKGVYESFSSRRKSLKSSFLILESFLNQRAIDPSFAVLLNERCAEKKKGRLLYCYIPAWIRNSGLILCFQADGKNFVNGDMENHLKAQSFRLAQWLNIIQSPRRNIPRTRIGRVRNLERRHHGCRH